MKNLSALFVGIILLATATMSHAQNEWDLKKCIDYALDNNIQIKRQEINTQYYQNELSQAKSNLLPTLNGNISNSFNFGRSLTYENTYENVNSTEYDGYLSTSVTLWNGFSLKNTVKQKDLDLQATIQDFQKAKDDITLNIAASYLEILYQEEIVQVDSAQIELTQQQIKQTQQLVDAGSSARGALLEIEAQLAREELQLVNDINSLQLAYLTLYQLLELPISESFKIEKPKFPEIRANSSLANSFNIYKDAMQIRPEIKAAKLRVESATRQLDIARGARYPSLKFDAYYYNLYNNKYTDLNNNDINFGDQLKNNKRYNMGFTLSIPIFNQFQVKNSISNAKLQVTDYEYQLQSAKNVLRKDIEQAHTNALAALNSYISSEKAVKSTQEAFRYTKEKFNVGMINSVEYSQSKNNLTVAQSELLQARYKYIFRTKILDFYNGIPIEL